MTTIRETITGMDAILAAAAPSHLLAGPLKEFHQRVDVIIQRRARENASAYTDRGGLVNSIQYQIDPQPIPLYSVVGSNLVYARAAEFGRLPGSFPPLDPIEGWVHRKGIVSGYTSKSGKFARRRGVKIQNMERSVAYLIARKIFLHGSPARPFLRKAYEESKGDIQAEVANLGKAIGKQWGQK